MQFLYKIPGYILLLFGGFCLSWGGFIIRSFEEASIWQILFLRSFFFLLALIAFLFVTYKKNTFNIIKESGLPGLLGGFVLSFSFVAFVVAMSNTTVANVVFIISTQTMFLALFVLAEPRSGGAMEGGALRPGRERAARMRYTLEEKHFFL